MGILIENSWRMTKAALRFVVFRILKLNLADDVWEGIIQFVKFGIVGLINNAVSCVVYLFLIWIGVHYTPANIVGFTVGVFNSYYWNNKYVFNDKRGRAWWKTIIRTYLSYAGTGIVLSNILLYIWIENMGISELIAPFINLIITAPVNFVANKLWAYKK